MAEEPASMASLDKILSTLDTKVSAAVKAYWTTREGQAKKQEVSGRSDQGARAAVTGGAQMDGFIQLLAELIMESGARPEHVFFKKSLELPGFFRPTKEWDLLVVRDGQLILALEAKSQVGPSFGNNFNNRTEEAMGSAVDLWTAYREGAFNKTVKPWLGYLFLLEDCAKSRCPVKVKEPHFEVFPEFKAASYAKRYEIFCRKLLRERHYSASTFLLASKQEGLKGVVQEPAEDLTFKLFARSLYAHVNAFGRGA
jgi:hypothetical protein